MKKLGIALLLIVFAVSLNGCEKTDYEKKAEKSANERADRNRADHERRNQ